MSLGSFVRAGVVMLLLSAASACAATAPSPTRVTLVSDAGSAEQFVAAWLAKLTDVDSASRGFEFVHPSSRTRDVELRYFHAAQSITREGVSWHSPQLLDEDSASDVHFYLVEVQLDGGSSAMPAALIETGIVQRLFVDGDDEGIFVTVRVDGRGTGLALSGG